MAKRSFYSLARLLPPHHDTSVDKRVYGACEYVPLRAGCVAHEEGLIKLGEFVVYLFCTMMKIS